MISHKGTALRLALPATHKQLLDLAAERFALDGKVRLMVGAELLTPDNYEVMMKEAGGRLVVEVQGQPDEQGQLTRTVVRCSPQAGLAERQCQTVSSMSNEDFLVVQERGLDTKAVLKRSVQYVMECLKYQVDIKWVNFTINDVQCKSCRKYPLIGRVLHGPKKEPLCEQCYAQANSAGRTTWIGQGLIQAFFKKKVDNEQAKRQFIPALASLTGGPAAYFQRLMQNNPKKAVEEFLELALEF